MAVTIKLKNASGSDPSASDLVVGEVAIRTDTGKLFTKKDDNSVAEISGGGIDDGDKGDITVSNSGATFTIDNDAVTYAKIQNVSATNRILGRDSSGAGVIEEITPANLRTMINVEDGATADQSNSEIKTAYEANSNTNAFTDALLSKLNGIATGAIADIVNDSSPQLGGDLDTNSHNILLDDDHQVKFGASNDFVIYHEASGNTRMVESGSGELYLDTSSFRIRNAGGSEIVAKFISDGACELYHNNVKMLETTSTGISTAGAITAVGGTFNADVQLTGDNYNVYWDKSENTLEFKDNAIAAFGDNDDFTIQHLSSDSTTRLIETSGGSLYIQAGNFVVMNPAGNEFMINAAPDGSVSLYHNHVKKIETSSAGATVTGVLTSTSNLRISGELDLGTSNGNKFMDVCLGDNYGFYLRSTSGEGANHEALMQINRNGGAKLYFDANERFETTNDGIDITGQITASSHIDLPDAAEIKLGDSDELSISHAANGHSYILENGSGDLNIHATHIKLKDISGNSKLETTSAGVSVTGNITVSGTVDGRDMATDGAKLDGIAAGATSTTINSNADNRVITGSGSSNTLNGEANFTYDGTYLNYTANVNQTYPNGSDTNYMASMANNNGIKFVFRGDGLYLGNGLTGSNQGSGPSNTNIHLNTNGTIEAGGATFSGDVSFNGGGGAVSIGANSDIEFGNGTWTGNTVKIQQHDNTLYLVGGTNGFRFREGGTDRWLIDGSGNLEPATNNTYNIGSSSLRVANLYVNDMHFANSPENVNKVDGTWGDWTLQEGEDQIYMLNNRNGKKYAMNLTEIV